ncbi:S8 family peptidase [Paenibacillus gorillae]|uniref:S8 family peptidase n=1 Tax=Paenibacillus gorillae TaxID=1243662 RepID=UPI0009E01686|nr:S8 family serine peptidase [Paenibacillus gorillae]
MKFPLWHPYPYKRAVAMLLLAALICACAAPASSVEGQRVQARPASAEVSPHGWLLKWSSPEHAHALHGTVLLRRQSETAVDLIAPADPCADIEPWLHGLRSTPGVEYVQPNSPVHVLNEPSAEGDGASEQRMLQAAAADNGEANDPELGKQIYLKQIGALEAWKSVRTQTLLTIAVIDTGVDLNHPDLKDNLVNGINLVQPNQPPDDDNGHGTSVAGVIAASGNNGTGVAGILWKAKLMPIKALDHRGDGTEQELGEAILYAVRKQAKIIVLSVGLYRYSPYMLDIVDYAESKGALLVAAAGNDGVNLGSKAAVKYPAAYPTVLAVGGAQADGRPDARSNPGPELDLVAPWNVYTTAVGGRYKKEEGTSMAAPQVAAAAALIWARYPEMKPYQIRELLRQTAKDIGARGFDNQSGYGLLQIDKAVTTSLKADGYEPNDRMSQASYFPLPSQLTAVLETGGDKDWYAIDAPYDGVLNLRYESMLPQGKTAPPIRLSHYADGKLLKSEETKLGTRGMEWKVRKGRQLVLMEAINAGNNTRLPYMLNVSFRMAEDAYESNDKTYSAFTLQPRSQTINGSFHQTADRDWYVINFTHSGTLRLRLSTNTVRIDPGLAVQRAGQTLVVYDDQHEGETEQSPLLTVTPGKYYIRVHNAISAEASPTVGTYTLKLEYSPKYDDPNEPNDKYYEALLVSPGTEYVGVIGTKNDVDWFQLRLQKPSIVDMRLKDVPEGFKMKLEAYDKKQKLIFSQSTGSSGSLEANGRLFQPGVYYVKLTSNAPFDNQYYRFRINADELTAGFRDISDHWAKEAIVAMNSRGIVSGTGKYVFEPDRPITRAEAVAMVVKAYKPVSLLKPANTVRFKDVDSKHWAYDAIRRAVEQGWIKGFPSGQFKPDQPVTRAEMTVIVGQADGVKPIQPTSAPYADVSKLHWAAPMLQALKLKGSVSGKEGNRFQPDAKASRAEYTTLLFRLYV